MIYLREVQRPMFYKLIKLLYLSTIVSSGLFLGSCNSDNKSISFYYWKTSFQLNSYEKETLGNNDVKTLYVRYFDVDFTPGSFEPEPVSPVSMDISTKPYRIVPVIFIKNRVFERVDSAGIHDMVENI